MGPIQDVAWRNVTGLDGILDEMQVPCLIDRLAHSCVEHNRLVRRDTKEGA